MKKVLILTLVLSTIMIAAAQEGGHSTQENPEVNKNDVCKKEKKEEVAEKKEKLDYHSYNYERNFIPLDSKQFDYKRISDEYWTPIIGCMSPSDYLLTLPLCSLEPEKYPFDSLFGGYEFHREFDFVYGASTGGVAPIVGDFDIEGEDVFKIQEDKEDETEKE